MACRAMVRLCREANGAVLVAWDHMASESERRIECRACLSSWETLNSSAWAKRLAMAPV